MSEPTESPGAPAPGNAPDVSRQIAVLTEAVNRLVQAQQFAPRATSAPTDIGGDIPGGGQTLLPGVDYTKLSPLQQITLGLKDAKPVALSHPEAPASSNEVATNEAPSGAD